jgi:hypothetical protein
MPTTPHRAGNGDRGRPAHCRSGRQRHHAMSESAYTNYARQNVARGNRHARAYRNALVGQNQVPNNFLVNEPSLSTQRTGGRCGR